MGTNRHCYSFTEILLYLQNKMSRKDESKFQRHLLECEKCRETTRRLRELINSLGYGGKKKVISYVVAATIAVLTIGGGTIVMLKQDEKGMNEIPQYDMMYKDSPFHENKDSISDTINTDSIKILIPKKKH